VKRWFESLTVRGADLDAGAGAVIDAVEHLDRPTWAAQIERQR
jgi:hypothetical protein